MKHRLLQYFKYDHLPAHLAEISEPFCLLANAIDSDLADSPEKTVCLRKLLEAKDCAVRAGLG